MRGKGDRRRSQGKTSDSLDRDGLPLHPLHPPQHPPPHPRRGVHRGCGGGRGAASDDDDGGLAPRPRVTWRLPPRGSSRGPSHLLVEAANQAKETRGVRRLVLSWLPRRPVASPLFRLFSPRLAVPSLFVHDSQGQPRQRNSTTPASTSSLFPLFFFFSTLDIVTYIVTCSVHGAQRMQLKTPPWCRILPRPGGKGDRVSDVMDRVVLDV